MARRYDLAANTLVEKGLVVRMGGSFLDRSLIRTNASFLSLGEDC
jgi:hypothetical protein